MRLKGKLEKVRKKRKNLPEALNPTLLVLGMMTHDMLVKRLFCKSVARGYESGDPIRSLSSKFQLCNPVKIT